MVARGYRGWSGREGSVAMKGSMRDARGAATAAWFDRINVGTGSDVVLEVCKMLPWRKIG